MAQIAICCADIGSVRRGKFGWASYPEVADADHVSPRSLVRYVAERLEANVKVALGFECPLWVPVADEPSDLTKARHGEGNRAWSAGAGAGSLATGLTEVAWILDRIHHEVPRAESFLDWEDFKAAANGLFIWEAFVTADAKRESHKDDAQAAVEAFRDALPDPSLSNALAAMVRIRSLIGGALLWSGWTKDLEKLDEPSIVIKPQEPYGA